jgi:hypothetical protein
LKENKGKMQLAINKTKTVAVITTILLMASIMLIATMPIKAQLAVQQQSITIPPGVTPYWITPTEAFLNVRPWVVGTGQSILINVWINPSLGGGRYFLNTINGGAYKLTITKPDGTNETVIMPNTLQDTTSWLDYTVDQVGEWTFKFDFLGVFWPEGRYMSGYVVANTSGTAYPSAYYEPSSAPEITVTVQEEVVYSWPELPYPSSDYWTRPLQERLNREWWPIAGNYPGNGYSPLSTSYSWMDMWNKLFPDCNPYWADEYQFHPWVQGPNSFHILWKRTDAIAGYVGPLKGMDMTATATQPSVVFAGRAYATQTVRWYNGSMLSCAVCYDLRTGEMYYMNPTAAPFNGITPSIIGYTGTSAELMSISGTYLRKINPNTGALTSNVSISPLTSAGTYYMNQHCLVVQNIGNTTNPNYRLINWTTSGTSSNFASRIRNNISWPRSALPDYTDYGFGVGVYYSRTMPLPDTGLYGNYTLYGVSLTTGAELWTVKVPEEYRWFNPATQVADHGKIVYLDQIGTFVCHDLTTGNKLWESERMDYPWGSLSFGSYSIASAYGLIIRTGYDGIYAFNWTDGKIVWKYQAPAYAHFESPYADGTGLEIYPFDGSVKIADGKLWSTNTEHTPTSPATRGWGLHCVNITDGTLLWKVILPMSAGVIADGYMTASESSMGTMYVIGKGQSKTTVTAPETAVPLGTAVLIKGTVLDQSPAQPGTPCVSPESMTQQMEYLHLQMPIGGLWNNETTTGVPVELMAIDSTGAYYDLGTATTNGYSGAFAQEWTPPAEGKYEITATFAGDASYGSSISTTAVLVGPAQEPYPTQIPPEAPVDYMPTLSYILVAVVVAIIIGIIALLLALRKRP